MRNGKNQFSPLFLLVFIGVTRFSFHFSFLPARFGSGLSLGQIATGMIPVRRYRDMLTMHVVSVCVYFKRRQVVIPFPNKGVVGEEMGSRCVKDKKSKSCKTKLFLQEKFELTQSWLQFFLRMIWQMRGGPDYPGTCPPLHPAKKKNTGPEPGFINWKAKPDTKCMNANAMVTGAIITHQHSFSCPWDSLYF